jgi:peroxiredoxin Q/BCP
MIDIGEKIPDFDLINQNGEIINMRNYLGKKIILFFYPKASTPGCTAEACNLNENLNKLSDLDYIVLGASIDSVNKQKKFSDKFNFNFSLIADEDKKLVNYFGVFGRKKFMGKEYDGIFRTTFIINELGIIERIIDKVDTKNHVSQILNTNE